MARRDATYEVGMTLAEKANRALAHIERARLALRGPVESILRARSELAKALDILLQAEDDPYADTKLRPGLNRTGPTGAMGQEEWEAYQKQLKAGADA